MLVQTNDGHWDTVCMIYTMFIRMICRTGIERGNGRVESSLLVAVICVVEREWQSSRSCGWRRLILHLKLAIALKKKALYSYVYCDMYVWHRSILYIIQYCTLLFYYTLDICIQQYQMHTYSSLIRMQRAEEASWALPYCSWAASAFIWRQYDFFYVSARILVG